MLVAYGAHHFLILVIKGFLGSSVGFRLNDEIASDTAMPVIGRVQRCVAIPMPTYEH